MSHDTTLYMFDLCTFPTTLSLTKWRKKVLHEAASVSLPIPSGLPSVLFSLSLPFGDTHVQRYSSCPIGYLSFLSSRLSLQQRRPSSQGFFDQTPPLNRDPCSTELSGQNEAPAGQFSACFELYYGCCCTFRKARYLSVWPSRLILMY